MSTLRGQWPVDNAVARRRTRGPGGSCPCRPGTSSVLRARRSRSRSGAASRRQQAGVFRGRQQEPRLVGVDVTVDRPHRSASRRTDVRSTCVVRSREPGSTSHGASAWRVRRGGVGHVPVEGPQRAGGVRRRVELRRVVAVVDDDEVARERRRRPPRESSRGPARLTSARRPARAGCRATSKYVGQRVVTTAGPGVPRSRSPSRST